MKHGSFTTFPTALTHFRGREHILNQSVLIHEGALLSSKKLVSNTCQALWGALALKTKLLRLCWWNSTCLNPTLAVQRRLERLGHKSYNESCHFGPLWSPGLRLDRLFRGGGCRPRFLDEWTETGQIAFIPPPLHANHPLHTSKQPGRHVNQRGLTSALRPQLQTSCHIWRSAAHANTHCGWANTAADLGSGQIASLEVSARWGPWLISKGAPWAGGVDKWKFSVCRLSEREGTVCHCWRVSTVQYR